MTYSECAEFIDRFFELAPSLNDGVIVLYKNWFEALGDDERPNIFRSKDLSWSDAKSILDKKLHEKMGFRVSRRRGGAYELTSWVPNAKFGRLLAKKMKQDGVDHGNVKEKLKGISGALGPRIDDGFKLTITAEFKQAFAEPLPDSVRFKFNSSRGYDFDLQNAEIKFGGRETELHNRLESQAMDEIQSAIGLEYGETYAMRLSGLEHGALQNVDFGGYTLWRSMVKDRIVSHAIEIKRDNAIASIFAALSQASSYKQFADVVWIAAPGLNASDAVDVPRFREFVTRCEVEGFGILDIQLVPEENKNIEGVFVQKVAKLEEVDVPFYRDWIMSKFDCSFCPKCSAILSSDLSDEDEEVPVGCKWKVHDRCAKGLEDQLLSAHGDQVEPGP